MSLNGFAFDFSSPSVRLAAVGGEDSRFIESEHEKYVWENLKYENKVREYS